MEENEFFKKLISLLSDSIKSQENLMQDDEEEDDEDEDENEKKKIGESLVKDYSDFIKWAFGKVENMTHKETVKAWKKLHPEEDLPRIFYLKHRDSVSVILYLVLDAYPIYLKEKGEL